MKNKLIENLKKSRLSTANSPSKYDSFIKEIQPSLKYDSSNSRVNMPGSISFRIPESGGPFVSTNFWINQTFNPENVDNVYAVGSGMDSKGNSFVIIDDYWTSPNNPNQNAITNLLLQKFNDAGDLVWNRSFTFEEAGVEYLDINSATMTIDKEDNVIVFLLVYSSGYSIRRTGIIKFDNDGNELWSIYLNDANSDISTDAVNSVAFDASNNMYASFYMFNPYNTSIYFPGVKKISPEGVVLASKTITFTGTCNESYINVNSIGEVYFVGTNGVGKQHVIKLDSSLNEIWNKSFTNNYGYAYGVALDKDENIVFTSGNGAGANSDPLYGVYVKVSPAGEVIWTTRISNTVNPNYSLGTYQLNSDSDGNVYISSIFPASIPGYAGNANNTLMVAKLSSNGSLEWAYALENNNGGIYSWWEYTPISGNVVNNCLVLGYYDNEDPYNVQLFKLPLTLVADGIYGDYTITNITDLWTTSNPALTLSDDTATYADEPINVVSLTYVTFEGNTYTTNHTSL